MDKKFTVSFIAEQLAQDRRISAGNPRITCDCLPPSLGGGRLGATRAPRGFCWTAVGLVRSEVRFVGPTSRTADRNETVFESVRLRLEQIAAGTAELRTADG